VIPTITVTVYAAVDPSWAVTVYVTGLVKSCAVPDAGVMLWPVWVIAGVKLVTSVPAGTGTKMFVPLITPVAVGLLKVKAVIALEEFSEAPATVTVYVTVDPSSAVTVYVTGLVKSLAVPDVGLMFTPVWVIMGVRAVTDVP
jgi:hypothetical protein